MRFQDAARDARAVVYAGIQADPAGRARGDAARRRDARPASARAGRDERRDDRPRRLADDVPDLVRTGGDRPTPADAARSEAILEASLAVADRGEQVRSQVRGALVEEVAAPAPRPAGRRGGGPSRAADPVRWRSRGDPSVRRDRRARRDGRGLRLQVGRPWHQRGRPPPAGRRADARRPRRTNGCAVALVVFDARRSCDVRLGRQTAPHEGTELVSLETLDALAGPAA